MASSDDERNILAMPVQLDTVNQGEVVKSKKRHPRDGRHMQRALQEGSLFIQSENYIISNQVRLPQEIIKEGVSKLENVNHSKLKMPSTTDIVENVKILKFPMVCAILLLLILPLATWLWFVLQKPTVFVSTKKKVSLLRCFIEYIYEAMLDIYQ